MSKTPRNNEIRTTDDAILFLKNLPGFASYHRYFETKLAGDFAFELAKFMSKRETELAEARAEIERRDKLIEQMREALRLTADEYSLHVSRYENRNAHDDQCYIVAEQALAAERGE